MNCATPYILYVYMGVRIKIQWNCILDDENERLRFVVVLLAGFPRLSRWEYIFIFSISIFLFFGTSQWRENKIKGPRRIRGGLMKSLPTCTRMHIHTRTPGRLWNLNGIVNKPAVSLA